MKIMRHVFKFVDLDACALPEFKQLVPRLIPLFPQNLAVQERNQTGVVFGAQDF